MSQAKEEAVWIKRHVDTLVIIGSVVTACVWINGKFNDLEKDMAVMKAVMITKEIMPRELATVALKEENTR